MAYIMANMIILVDMDNTLVEFDKGLLKKWRMVYPNKAYVPLEDRKAFHPHMDYPEHLQQKVQDICHAKGFIRSLDPTPGGVEAVHEMIRKGHDVRFCTSYLLGYNYCVVEKYQWIEHYFGPEFIDRIVLTRDKTLIRGDLLIDDKPAITGLLKPAWEHIIYDRPHNCHVTSKQRINWTDDWQSVVFTLHEDS